MDSQSVRNEFSMRGALLMMMRLPLEHSVHVLAVLSESILSRHHTTVAPKTPMNSFEVPQCPVCGGSVS